MNKVRGREDGRERDTEGDKEHMIKALATHSPITACDDVPCKDHLMAFLPLAEGDLVYPSSNQRALRAISL